MRKQCVPDLFFSAHALEPGNETRYLVGLITALGYMGWTVRFAIFTGYVIRLINAVGYMGWTVRFVIITGYIVRLINAVGYMGWTVKILIAMELAVLSLTARI